MRLIEVEWDAYGVMRLRPARPWPPHESLKDVGELEALQLLLEACKEVLQPKYSFECEERHRERVVEVRKRITQEQAHGIALAFVRKCYAVARERADIAATLGDPRQPTQPEEADQEVAWPEEPTQEEEVERLRAELDRMLERYRFGVHGS